MGTARRRHSSTGRSGAAICSSRRCSRDAPRNTSFACSPACATGWTRCCSWAASTGRRTVAYSRENHPAIFINRKGREPGGIVEPGEPTLRVRQEIVDRLLGLRCPESSEPIVDRVTFGEEVFQGPEAWRGPDILFSFRGHAYVQRPTGPDGRDGFLKLLTPAERERAEITDRPSGIHRDLGVFVAAGPAIPAAREIGCVDLLDVTPTILYLLGVPVPDDMDGRVLVELFDPAFVEANPVRMAPSAPTQKGPPGVPSAFEEDEERIIRERLEGLGYID